jgi:hypothetical protein
MWPAFFLFVTFAWMELIWNGRDVPARLAGAMLLYSGITWTGMFVFGQETWRKHGEMFTVVFGIFARFAPLASDESAGNGMMLRLPACGLLEDRKNSWGMTLLVITLLATVTFDGMLFVLLFISAYLSVCKIMAATTCGTGGGTAHLARRFVFSLLPISIAYHIAHYFSYLFNGGQLIIPLLSDPFGFGWDLFGTAAYQPNIGLVSPILQWYVAVVAIVVGHVIAVYVAHLTALSTFGERRMALRSQLSIIVLMVSYTMLSLWILSQPIIETRSGGWP